MKKKDLNYIVSCLFFLFISIHLVKGQEISISLEDAISVAQKNNIGLERDKLVSEQRNLLAEAGLMKQASKIYISGEEFDFNESGIHSLNIEQNFYLPATAKAHRNYYQSEAVLAGKKLEISEQELKWEVSKAFYVLLYLAKQEEFLDESVHFYEDFLSKTRAKIEAGESGKIPELAANAKLGQARLELEHNEEQYQVALSLFNSWLQSDTLFEASGSLEYFPELPSESISNSNIHLQLKQAGIEVAAAEVNRKESLLLPEISSGLKLQTIAGKLPYFGYQIGLNIPLFKKAYRGHIQAAKVGLMVEESDMKATKLRIDRTLSELQFRLEHQIHIIEYLEEELAPIVQERHDINQKAYEAGEIGYLESLDGLEELLKVKLQQLDALFKFNLLRKELAYWLGN
jgi:cobalt-zinc-cadmium resistance protein CzcA